MDMKKIIFKAFFLLMLLFSSFGIFAQSSGNNYIKVHYINPMGQYGNFYSQGIGAEYGHSFYFDLVMGELICPGIDVTFVELGVNAGKKYSYAENYPTVLTDRDDYVTEGGFLATFGPKIGLIAQMELIDGLFIETSAKYCPTLVFGSRTLADTPSSLRDETAGCFAFSNRFSINLELKYNWFSFGGEFLFGKAKLDYAKEIIPDLDNDLVPSDKIELGMNTFKLYVGFNF